ncbi:MAG TPA: hypothetical protein VJ997_07875 [Longimicrobiales bacterium]|nr:hypothetical protein [Longimicrobiales bacterium]
MILTLFATLLPTACGVGDGTRVAGGAQQTQASALGDALAATRAPQEALTAADSASTHTLGRRDLEHAERNLARTRRSVADGKGVSAGSTLALAVRELEDGLARTGAGITPVAAATFEDARRTADRWQAGAGPSDRDATTLLERLDLEIGRLARSLNP